MLSPRGPFQSGLVIPKCRERGLGEAVGKGRRRAQPQVLIHLVCNEIWGSVPVLLRITLGAPCLSLNPALMLSLNLWPREQQYPFSAQLEWESLYEPKG